MCKKITLYILLILIVGLPLNNTVKANPEKIAKLKAAIVKLGTGTEARIKVRLKNKKKIKGYVSKIETDKFVVINSKTKKAVEIPYPQVKQIKGRNNLTGKQVAWIIVGVVTVLGFIAWIFND